ncbi:MAG: DUF493 family protein [Flavobacteriaceae bacterium]|nr:DUF493 family protein [Flavobacteriaceae bacterium]
MDHPQESPNFSSHLESLLKQSQSWPGQYVFKFIVSADSPNIKKIKSRFKDFQHTVSQKQSKRNRYTSISIKAFMKTPKQVTSIYKEIHKLEGVVVL